MSIMRQINYWGIAVLSTLLITSCSQPKNSTAYLKNVLDNLEAIESASYYAIIEAWVPGDTAARSITRVLISEYDNPSDTTIGASFIRFSESDATLLKSCYDGNMAAYVNYDTKTIMVDSFKTERFPFRLISPPFFNYTKNILKYALETTDSISLQIKEEKESVYVGLTIFEDTQIEFFGKAYRMPVYPDYYVEPTSKYELWIDKKTNLPYKKRREMSHDISVETISDIKTNEMKVENFVASDYFPPDYSFQIRGKGSGSISFSKANLTGKKAPEWSLYSTGNQLVLLSDIKSKVTLLMFTSVSCGPCKIAIPYLNGLISEYDKNEVEIVAIECSTRNMDVLKTYRDNNDIRYTLLQSNDEVKEAYGILGFPIFFILDEDYTVQKIIHGYNQQSFGDEITGIIRDLL
ncbi:Peroxiredoxin [Porphyromonadaceae bacterium NLAE-zl-C104]|nr:Peroxiredoxin [Porphyromonadaceae bacterium NLAE-zl-C104]